MTTTPEHPATTFPDRAVLTNSSEACFKTCPRKYLYQYGYGLRPAYAPTPLRFGNAWHLGVGLYEQGVSIEDAIDAVRIAYADQPCPPYLEAEEYAVEQETVAAMVRGHYDRWHDNAILETVAVEVPFDIPIRNPETGAPTPLYRSAGKIDRIAKLPDGRFCLVERKTTAEALDAEGDYWGRLLIDSQISRYVLAARELGYPVETTVYDVARKPAIRPKAVAKAERAWATSQGNYFGLPLAGPCPERETPQMFGARLLADLRERPAFYFARNEIARLDHDLEEFRWEQWQIQRAIHEATRHGRFYRNTAACTAMGRCPFFDVCRGLRGDPNEQVPDGFRRASRLHEELAESTTGEAQ